MPFLQFLLLQYGEGAEGQPQTYSKSNAKRTLKNSQEQRRGQMRLKTTYYNEVVLPDPSESSERHRTLFVLLALLVFLPRHMFFRPLRDIFRILPTIKLGSSPTT